LKAEVPDEFIGLGKLEIKPTTTAYAAESGGTRYYLWTSVVTPRAMRARMIASGERPAAVWVNGAAIGPGAAAVKLRSGASALLLRYDKPGRGYVVFEDPESPADWKQTYPLASAWYNRPGLLVYDTRPGVARPAGWYRTTSPPGLRGLTMVVRGAAALWLDGRPIPLAAAERQRDGSNRYRVAVAALPAPRKIAIRVEQDRGSCAGAAFMEPMEFDCGPGRMAAGDWSGTDGLSSYSGGVWYRKTVALGAAQSDREVWLDLGGVSSSAEVHVNGKRAGVKLAPPYRVDISKLVQAGPNRIEVLVYSALSNHYQTIPTRYRGTEPSGLLGPVKLIVK
jgi:hypothetical protein